MAYPAYDSFARLMATHAPGLAGQVARQMPGPMARKFGAGISTLAQRRQALAGALIAAAGALAGPNPTGYPLGGLQRLGLGLGAGLHAASLLGHARNPLAPIALAAGALIRERPRAAAYRHALTQLPPIPGRHRRPLRVMPAAGGGLRGIAMSNPAPGGRRAVPHPPATPYLPGAPRHYAGSRRPGRPARFGPDRAPVALG